MFELLIALVIIHSSIYLLNTLQYSKPGTMNNVEVRGLVQMEGADKVSMMRSIYQA